MSVVDRCLVGARVKWNFIFLFNILNYSFHFKMDYAFPLPTQFGFCINPNSSFPVSKPAAFGADLQDVPSDCTKKKTKTK